MNKINTIKLTKELVKIPTITSHNENIKKGLSLVVKSLSPSVKTKLLTHNNVMTLWCTNTNFSNPDILLLCHLDVVAANKIDFIPRISNGNLRGRGSFDMKGSLVAMINAINKSNKKSNIQLLITTDEEIGGKNGANWFFTNHNIIPKIAIIPDGISLNHLITKQKGPLHLVIKISGQSCHASTPWNGSNPLIHLNKIINDISKINTATNNQSWLPTITPTNIIAESSINQVSDSCTFTLDVRLTNRSQLKKVKGIINKHGGVIINTFGDGKTLNQNTTDSLLIWKNIVEKTMKKKVKEALFSGASDARHLPKSTQAIITRTIGGNAHSKNEWVSINSICNLSKITTEFIKTMQENV